MTKICINEEALIRNGTSIGEILVLIGAANKVEFNEVEDKLLKDGLITAARDNLFQPIGWRVTKKGQEILTNVIIDSEESKTISGELEKLAAELKDIFPKGKKDGTNLYWADGIALIVRRLKIFFKKYGDDFTAEQIVQAATKYVESFNGDYRYMKLLKYFIFKEKVNADGVEPESELVTYIENAGQEENLRNDWTSSIN